MKRSQTWRRYACRVLVGGGRYSINISIAASVSIAMIAAALDAAAPAEVAADDSSPLVGWAAHGESTTGGAGGPEYRVTDADDLARRLKSDEPKVVRIEGVVQVNGSVRVGSRTTLIGARGAALVGGGLQIRKARNVIVRNLAISEAADAIDIEDSQHVWIDHCDLSRCKDGLLDIKRGADFITVSWNRFHDHHKTCLLGHSDKESIRTLDAGHLRTTYHHNFFDGTKTRHPRVRFADGVHVFNNYFRGNEYGVASLMDAGVIVESNVFEDVERPTVVAYGDSPDPGRLVATNNRLVRSGPLETRGEVDRTKIEYRFTLDSVDGLAERLRREAGVMTK